MDTKQLWQDQAQDPVLSLVPSWVGMGQQPPWTAFLALDLKTKALHSQWPMQKKLLYQRWQAPEGPEGLTPWLNPASVYSQ